MVRTLSCIWIHAGLVIAVLASPVDAGKPTFSLEGAGINGTPIPNGPVSSLAVFPGDVIQAEIYVRDWSPDEQALSGYQAALLPVSFSSGDAGYIEPLLYEEKRNASQENPDNSFIDKNHPRFVHLGKNILALADTRSQGYRWMSVVLTGQSPVSKQDGIKYYCASVNFLVSNNARGTFTLQLDSNPDSSGLRDGTSRPIDPVSFEDLTVRVMADPARVVDGLNKKSTADKRVDANKDGTNDYRDVLASIAALNPKS